MFTLQLSQASLQLSHAQLVGSLALFLDVASASAQSVFLCVLLLLELLLGLLELLSLVLRCLLTLLAGLLEFLKSLNLGGKLSLKISDSLRGKLYLILHADVVLEGCAELGEPKRLDLLEGLVESLDLTVLGADVPEVPLNLDLHILAAECADKLQNVSFDAIGVANGIVFLLLGLPVIRVKWLHVDSVDSVGGLEGIFASCLRDQQGSDFRTERSLYNDEVQE